MESVVNKSETDRGVAVRLLTTVAEIEQIRTEWEAMQWHPNADIDYFLLINQLHQQEPRVFVIREGDEVVAIGAGRLGRRQLKCSFGYKTVFAPEVAELSIISGGLMGKSDDATLKLFVANLISQLKAGAADVASIAEVKTDSPLWKMINRSPSWPCRDMTPMPQLHYGITLPKSKDGLFMNMKSKHRTNLRRLGRILERDFPDGVNVRCFAEVSEVPRFCDEAEFVAAKSYLRALGVGFFDNAAARDQMSLYAARGAFRGYVLYIKEKPCAFWYGNLYKSVFFIGMTAFDPEFSDYEIGTILLIQVLEDLVENGNGVTRFDFGLGEAAYKSKFSTEVWSEAKLLIFAPSVRGIGINLIRTPLLSGNKLLREMLKRLNLEAKIKRIWRNRRSRVLKT